MWHTLLVVGETAFGFFFLILMPGTGAELRASKNPVASIAKKKDRQMDTKHQLEGSRFKAFLQIIIILLQMLNGNTHAVGV